MATPKTYIKKLHCRQINMFAQKHERNNAKKLQCKQNDMYTQKHGKK